MSYINKDKVINIVKAPPAAEFNYIKMLSKKQVLKALEILLDTCIITKCGEIFIAKFIARTAKILLKWT